MMHPAIGVCLSSFSYVEDFVLFFSRTIHISLLFLFIAKGSCGVCGHGVIHLCESIDALHDKWDSNYGGSSNGIIIYLLSIYLVPAIVLGSSTFHW